MDLHCMQVRLITLAYARRIAFNTHFPPPAGRDTLGQAGPAKRLPGLYPLLLAAAHILLVSSPVSIKLWDQQHFLIGNLGFPMLVQLTAF